ncbi:YqcC family protein [Vibrio vulnificus]|nr:YqcC family protein [Vibrio vulnificus]EIF5016645.1 YqcC family protein [Vibrio vulnificus]EIO2321984.1 YqcC family protein [Vibrio vulnificus]EIO4066615.1 YqcC family protein [Vibrio vulnificus]ELH0903031.1 YqcC family protein [Vibrio vulnificus]
MTNTSTLTGLLRQLELELKRLGWWDDIPPEPALLQSEMPFAVDTLAPQQWLQWIFIARIQQMMAQGASLPKGFLLTPYFEEAWKEQRDTQTLLSILRTIDEVRQ